ncbi:MAG: radical SAM family heme chaperone HemW [Bacteroidales bacterium]|nr:radical SAM family heme chaperone HemW [Bacteroidales bacterium]
MLPPKGRSSAEIPDPPFPGESRSGIYLHLPFCKRKCPYCNFFSLATKRYREDITGALVRELFLRKDYLEGREVSSVYLGGGTPSLMDTASLGRILDAVFRHFPVSTEAEITLEANPDDLVPGWFRSIRALPVNRLNIGVQSFRDDDLHYLGRVHDAGQALRAVQLAFEAGYDRTGIDLIYGIPTLSEKQWERNLDTVANLDIPHLSAYALTVEPRTILDHHIRNHQTAPVDPDQAARHFEILMDWAGLNGWIHYEISNFCRQDQWSRHNLLYWTEGWYLGAGPSAHSFNGSSRQWNVSALGAYIDAITGSEVPYEIEYPDSDERFNEYVMTGLRTMWGISPEEIRNRFGEEVLDKMLRDTSPWKHSGHILHSGGRIALTRKGKLLADRIASDLFR